MNRYSLLLVVGYLSFQGVEACNFTVPDNISGCENITRVLQQVSSCDKAEQVLGSFSRSANLSSDTLCLDIINILETTLTVSKLEKVAEVIDYIGTGSWLYLATRALLKRYIPCIQRHDILQSRFQRFLSHDITAFVMTAPCVVAFSSLFFNGSVTALIVSLCSSGIPALIGGTQFCLDCLWKIPVFLFKRCGKCLPTEKEKAADKEILRRFLEQCRSEIDAQLDALD